MIKILTKLIISSALFYNQVAWSLEYKCFVELDNDKTEIRLIKLPDHEKAQEAERQILLDGVYSADGRRKIEVLNVYECVLYTENFSSDQAKQLEKKTPL